MKWLIVVLILATVLIAGCTQISSVVCKPNWIYAPQGINEEYCKMACYNGYKSNNFKMEDFVFHECICRLPYHNVSQGVTQEGNYTKECEDICKRIFNDTNIEINDKVTPNAKCYCDVNNCNP